MQVDFKEEITRKKIEYAKKQKYKPWRCEKIRKLGFCLGAEDCEWNKKSVASRCDKLLAEYIVNSVSEKEIKGETVFLQALLSRSH